MAIINEELKLAYYSIPKVACSSQKLLHYELIHGEAFHRENHGGQGIHGIFGSPRFDPKAHAVLMAAGYWSYAVVRDPIQRLLSAYSDKVVMLGEVTIAAHKDPVARDLLVANELPTVPDLETFAANIEIYRKASWQVRQHTRHFRYFLGPDLTAFDRLYRLEDEMEALRDDLAARSGRKNLKIRHTNRNKATAQPLITDRARADLMAFLKPDYARLSGQYPEPLI